MKLAVTLRNKFRRHSAGEIVTISSPQSDDINKHTVVKCEFQDGDTKWLRISAFREELAIIKSFEEEIPLSEAQASLSRKNAIFIASKDKDQPSARA